MPVEPTDSTILPVLITAAAVTGLCVLVHYEGLRLLLIMLKRRVCPPRLAVVCVIFGLLLLHITEIFLYGFAYAGLEYLYADSVGNLIGAETTEALSDRFYFSAAVYTTVGFGDIVSVGALRTLVALEALTGLVLITWSASFTFLIMEYTWKQTILREEG